MITSPLYDTCMILVSPAFLFQNFLDIANASEYPDQ